MFNADASRHGRNYYCVSLYDDREVYLFADEVLFHENGDLIFKGRPAAEEGEAPTPDAAPQVLMAFAPSQWSFVYAASVVDGTAIAVAHWPEQVVEGE